MKDLYKSVIRYFTKNKDKFDKNIISTVIQSMYDNDEITIEELFNLRLVKDGYIQLTDYQNENTNIISVHVNRQIYWTINGIKGEIVYSLDKHNWPAGAGSFY